jgi:hypothetical protein
MELSAVSDQKSVKILFLMPFAESFFYNANLKTLISVYP